MPDAKLKKTITKFLGMSTMEFPTWEKIRKELKVKEVNLMSLGHNPLTNNNTPVYTSINSKDVKTPCGIDVPTLLEPNGKSKGLIIILGESALRTDDDITTISQTPNNTILGTPYAIHLEKCPPKCAVYRKIFDALLREKYSLYITDIIKVWWKDKNLEPDDTDIKILGQELQRFKDKNPIIVAWGKKSQDALKRNEPKTDFLPLPHPGVNNWDSWKLRIFMKAVINEKLEYATDVYGKVRNIGEETKTNEDIVANEAVRSIIEHMEKNKSVL